MGKFRCTKDKIMNPWVALDVEKRKRLVEKGVLPTTFTGVSSVFEGNFIDRKDIPTFPHLLTPINQPFRKYQGFFGHFTCCKGDVQYGPYVHYGAEDINLQFLFFLCSPEVSIDKQETIISSQAYHNAKKVFPDDDTTSGYCFFRLNETIYYVKKTKEKYTLHEGMIDKASTDPHLYQLFLSAFSFDAEDKSVFYTTQQMVVGGGIFARAFNTTLMNATYTAAAYSLLKKMEDNLYQLFCAHPYYFGSALLHGKVSSFLYHLLGMFHALVSLVLDPLVEFTALITRTAFAPKPDNPEDLFPETSSVTPLLMP